MSDENPFHAMEPIRNTAVEPAVGVAALALNFALRYHDISTVQDGALYQQYKLEGRNMLVLHLDAVFETAMKMEAHLMGASDRIASLIIDALTVEKGGGDSAEKGRSDPVP